MVEFLSDNLVKQVSVTEGGESFKLAYNQRCVVFGKRSRGDNHFCDGEQLFIRQKFVKKQTVRFALVGIHKLGIADKLAVIRKEIFNFINAARYAFCGNAVIGGKLGGRYILVAYAAKKISSVRFFFSVIMATLPRFIRVL
jgi:hypothetical protein